VEFITAPGIFSAKRVDLGTEVLIKNMEIPPNGLVLDMGCGYGVVGVFLGKYNNKLTIHLIDQNQRATELAKKNLQLNSIKNYKIFLGDFNRILIENKNLYDGIYFNPPIRIGQKNYISYIINALEFLRNNGYLFIVIKHKLGAESALNKIIEELESQDKIKFYDFKVIAKNSGYWVMRIFKLPKIE
jgi:16S rRNA (guanine1207-N2)-methyltransferase